MDPVIATFLIAALTGVGAFAAFLVKWALAHLESDLAYSRKGTDRGTKLAEKATDVAEEKARG